MGDMDSELNASLSFSLTRSEWVWDYRFVDFDRVLVLEFRFVL